LFAYLRGRVVHVRKKSGRAGLFPFSRHLPGHVETTTDGVTAMSQRSDITLARSADVLRVAAPQVPGGMRAWGVVDGGASEKCFAEWDCQVVFRRGCSLTGSESSAAGDRQRSDVALARIVDVLGVAAPHGPAVVWYAIRRVHARMGERLLVVCRYAVSLGDGRAYCPG
ncbi:hypothetical protein TGVAND_439010, partial [Toxoplasma gondii VAND]